MAQIIAARAIAAQVKAEVARSRETEALGRRPGLAVSGSETIWRRSPT